MRTLVFAMIAAVPLCTIADQVIQPRLAVTQIVRRPSHERLDQIRRSLVAQIAVRDEAERAMRAPTTEEAAALAGSASGNEQIVSVAGGGVALRGTGAHMSMLVATRGDDGTVRVAHEAQAATASLASVKGGTHVR